MDYKVVISISRHSISFEYIRYKGGGGALQPMTKQSWPQPLAFFCQDDGNIIIGDGALYAVRAGTNNAFGHYFESLPNGLTYTIYGEKRPLNNLLLNASEQLFRDFFSSVLFNSYGQLDNNRSSMPLTIVCESDLENNERAYIYDLFNKGGYARMAVVQYDWFIDTYVKTVLSTQYACNHVLSVFCDGDDMTLTFIDAVNGSQHRSKRFQGLGIDPRVNYVSNQLWDTLIYLNPFLDKNKEWQVVQQTAKDFLNSGNPQRSARLRLSDGNEYPYNLSQTSSPISYEQDGLIGDAVDRFLAENGVKDKSGVLLLLRGNAADNVYFNSILRRGFDYKNIKSSDKKFIDEINKLIVSYNPPVEPPVVPSVVPSVEPPVVPPIVPPIDSTRSEMKLLDREWREVNASVNGMLKNNRAGDARTYVLEFLDKCKKAKYDDLISQVEVLLASIKDHHNNPVPPECPRQLEREWRVVRASANAMIRATRFTDARDVLDQFLNRCKAAGAKDIEADIVKIITTIPLTNPQSKVPGKTASTPSTKVKNVASKSTPADEIEKLLKDKKFTEARDLCRIKGDDVKVGILTKIIRSQRSINVRYTTLDDCRKLKNMSQIKNIINEIDEYIKLCESINVPCNEEKKLRNEYKNIK